MGKLINVVWRCEDCRSTEVQVKTWVRLNTEKVINPRDWENQSNDTWCGVCEAHVGIILDKSDMIQLDSVGCGVDPATGMTYPQYKDDTYDHNSGVHLKDCTGEWNDALSKKDAKQCREIIEKLYK